MGGSVVGGGCRSGKSGVGVGTGVWWVGKFMNVDKKLPTWCGEVLCRMVWVGEGGEFNLWVVTSM